MDSQTKKLLLIVGLVVGGFFLLKDGINLSPKTKDAETRSTVSGTIDFNGLKPEKKDEDSGKIVIAEREHGTEGFKESGIELSLTDGADWTWDGAVSGTTYDIRANLYLSDDLIKSSNIVTTTAPSNGSVLSLHIILADIPDYILEKFEAYISGEVDLNGYIPSGSSISVQQKGEEEKEFSDVVSNLAAADGVSWNWEKARRGSKYEIRAVLYSNGTEIGISQVVSVAAPASGEKLRIHSSAKAPVEKATISGQVILNGPVQDGSAISMLQRVQGEGDFKEFQNLPAVSKTPFRWGDAISGKTYEIIAVYQVFDKEESRSHMLKVPAPAHDEQVTIDTKLSLKPPSSEPQVECGSRDSTGKYNAKLTFPKIDSAQAYLLEIGGKVGDTDVMNQTVGNEDGARVQTVYIDNNKDYYARYAYSFCVECSLKDIQNWSDYSPTLGFKCTD
jgi:hypothetical protein